MACATGTAHLRYAALRLFPDAIAASRRVFAASDGGFHWVSPDRANQSNHHLAFKMGPAANQSRRHGFSWAVRLAACLHACRTVREDIQNQTAAIPTRRPRSLSDLFLTRRQRMVDEHQIGTSRFTASSLRSVCRCRCNARTGALDAGIDRSDHGGTGRAGKLDESSSKGDLDDPDDMAESVMRSHLAGTFKHGYCRSSN